MGDAYAAADYRGDLGDGLVRRWSTAADTEGFARLLGDVFRDADDPLPNPGPVAEARLMMRPGFPYMTAGDVAVVEDTASPSRPLVACTALWRHRWSYAGIPFTMGRPEIVATDPAYRRRGLVRALFEMVHARSAAEGHLLQGISGIPYFYRQFGYEYALDLDAGRTVYCSLIPPKRGEGPEPCSLRPATPADVERIVALYEARRAGSLVWHEAPAGWWRTVIAAWGETPVFDAAVRRVGAEGRYWMIVDAAGAACGYAWVAAGRRGRALSVRDVGLAPGIDLPLLAPSLLRGLRDLGERIPVYRSDAPPCSEIRLMVDRAHPLSQVLGDDLAPRVIPPYAWYIRIPDVAAFLRHISPALERRLARSFLAGHTGAVAIELYREGLQLRFERGRVAGIDPWRAPDYDGEAAALGCPPLTFVQLLLGYRGLDELRATYPDVWVKDEQRPLIATLFPKRRSSVEPLG